MVGQADRDAQGSLAEGLSAGAENEDDSPETRRASATAEQHGERLDKVVVALAPEFSRSHLQTLVRGRQVRLDGGRRRQPGAARARRSGDRRHPAAHGGESRLPGRAPAAVIVYEDDELLVVDKAAGMVVHPAAGNWSGTVLNALLARHPSSAALPRAGIVHRLDKDTSGLMVVGKTLPAVTALVRAIAAREVHRRYLAIAHGRPATRSFTIDAPVGRDPAARIRMAVVASGKPARTDIECLASTGDLSALRCTLHTGRTHQIRVHLSSRGLPLVGDRLYGGEAALGVGRQALHAAELAFAHPASGRPIAF